MRCLRLSLAPLYRLNYDYTISPTMLLHLGGGYRSNDFFVPTVNEEGQVPNYNAVTQLGLQGGTLHTFFPPMTGLCAVGVGTGSCSGQGGMCSHPLINGCCLVDMDCTKGNKCSNATAGESSAKDDKQLNYALDLIRGLQSNAAFPPDPNRGIPN